MRSKVRGTLDQLENVLLEGGSEARDLMNLLSILRGPDNRDIGTKEKVTMPLRSMIFPRLYEHTKNRTGFQQGCFPIRDKNGWGMREPGDMDPTHESNISHFNSHKDYALQAIAAQDGDKEK